MTGVRQLTRTWSGIEAPHPPCLRHDYPALLAMAEQMLESRRTRFPRLVEQQKLAADEAERQLALFEQIAADWRWICSDTGKVGEPAPYASIEARREALESSLGTIADLARRQGGFDDQLQHQAHCVIALRWHLEPGVESTTRRLARLTHTMRAEAAARAPSPQKPTPAREAAIG